MSEPDLTQIESVFHAVLERSPDDREQFLKEACNGDAALFAEVSSLISALDNGPGIISEPALNLGFQVLASPPEHSIIGTVIGQYQVISQLGKGGMGEVYLALDTKLGRKVALKFISPEFTGDRWAKRQLEKEAQSVAQLDHPNICSIFGYEEHGEHTFIVMQYIEGVTLAELIDKRQMSPPEIIKIAQQIVGAVSAAHNHGVLHRDVKPKNIMVTSSSQVKVLDFGLAKTIDPRSGLHANDSLSNLSEMKILKGTIAYMSPEQLRQEKLDFRSDVFSLGTVLHELVSGSNPFARDNAAETISAILTIDPPRLGEFQLERSQDLAEIIRKCLQKNRDDRYYSGSELLFELQTVLEKPKPRGRLWLPALSPRLVATLALGMVLLIIGILVYRSLTRTYRLAVLPFTNESGDPTLDYLEDGFAESLIARVSKLPRVTVSAFNAVKPYKGRGSSPQQLGQELGVDAVLVGRIVQMGGSTVMQTDLISTSDNNEIWGERYDIRTVAPSDLEENLIGRIASGMTSGLGLSKPTLPGRETNNNEAYLEYLRGRHLWHKRSKENLAKAIEKFKASIDLDAGYARAHAGLADCYALMNSPAYGDWTTEEAMRMAKSEVNKALAIDPELPEALTSLGVITLKYDWDWLEAERLLRQSIRVNSNDAVSHYWFATLLTITGRTSGAFTESALAKQLEPLSPSTKSNFCRQFYYMRDYSRAASCLESLLADDTSNVNVRYFQIFVSIKQGDTNRALTIAQNFPDDNRVFKLSALGYALAQAGKKDEALKILQETEELQKKNLIPSMEMAVIYLGLRDKDRLFVWLDKAYAERDSALIYLTADPAFDDVRSDPRFISLAQRMNLPLQSIPNQ
jgi:serine/threonine protein kinase/Flp pilus assembly protein TadD